MKFTDEEGVSAKELFRRFQYAGQRSPNAHVINGEVFVSFGRLPPGLDEKIQEEYQKFRFLSFRFRDRFNFAKTNYRVKEKDGEIDLEFHGGPNYEVNRHWQSKIQRNKVRW